MRDLHRIALIITLAWATPAFAQDPPEEAETTPPSLDELLGLDEEDAGAREAADETQQEELDRRLREREVHDGFLLALEGMEQSAERLDRSFDPGLGTQRIQEDVIARLDQLIDQVQQMSNQSASGGGSSSSNSRQRNPGQQGDRDTQQGGQRSESPSNSGDGGLPPRRDGDLATPLEETGSEWGALPERVRDMLFQGSRDQYSSLYERLTAEYYRRLAEESGG